MRPCAWQPCNDGGGLAHVAEIRWILLGLGLLLIAGIWWRGAWRSARTPAGGELRQSEPTVPALSGTPSSLPARPASTEWNVSPLEPLSIKTADFEAVPVLQMPLRTEAAPRAKPPAAPAPAREAQKIVTLRVCAPNTTRWSGKQLLGALERQELTYGRYQVFHRQHGSGASLFCVASLVEPGSFDLAQMPSQEFRGVTVFAVLPGALEPLPTFDAMVTAVRGLAESLSGMAQDSSGLPLSPARAAALREEVARFQAQGA
jgi:cell division protein ZipA